MLCVRRLWPRCQRLGLAKEKEKERLKEMAKEAVLSAQAQGGKGGKGKGKGACKGGFSAAAATMATDSFSAPSGSRPLRCHPRIWKRKSGSWGA